MPVKKYRTPNGQIVSESDLKAKYGDRFSELTKNNTFSEVNETVYKAPNGKYATESQLKEKYGDRFDELTKNNTFVLDEPLKKKENSIPTVQEPNLESVTKTTQQDTSLDLQSPTNNESYDLKTQTKTPDFSEPFSVENQPEISTPKKEKDEASYGAEVWRSLQKGSTRLGQSIAATPEFIYEAFAYPQNKIAEEFGIDILATDAEKLKDNIGVQNTIKDYYAGKTKELEQQSLELDRKYTGGITDNIKNGNIKDAFRLLGSSLAESLPSTLGIMLGGAYAKAPQLLAGISTVFGAGENEEAKENSPELSTSARTLTSWGKGLSEGVFSTIGTARIGVAAKEIIAKEGVETGGKLLKENLIDIYTQLLKKAPIPTAMIGEGVEEAATQITQNAIDIYSVGNKDMNLMDNVSDAFIMGVGGGGVFGVALEGLKKVSGSGTSKTDIEAVEPLLEKRESIINELEQQVKDGDVTKEWASKTIENFDQIKEQLQAVPNDYNSEEKAKAVELLKEKSAIEKEIEGKDESLVTAKKERVNAIKEELKGIKTPQDTQSGTKPIENAEIVPEKVEVTKPIEVAKNDNKANEEIAPIKENIDENSPQNNITPNGNIQLGIDKNIEQGQDKNIQKAVEPIGDKNDVEVVNNKANQQNDLVDAKNEYNRLNNKDKKGKKGTELRAKITNLAKELSFKISDKNNKMSVKGVNGKEAGKISFKEDIAEATQEDINNAKSQISKGVLNWSGDIGAERVNLGIGWGDIRKGQKDINAGKVNSVPAKRLIEALRAAKENGGYEYVQGSGGKIVKQFVTLDQIQRASNDENLNDAELQEINEKQNELFTQYKTDFNKLDLQSQNDIYENYENKKGNEELGGKPTEIRSSEDAIPNKQEEKPKQSTKERIAERIKINNAKIDDLIDAAKGADNIFGIPIRIKNIDDINTDGISQNALIDMIADIVKQAVAAGIHIDEAIKKTIEHFQKTIDFELNPDDVKAKLDGEKPKVEKVENDVEPKVEKEKFERKPGKKSLLNRAFEGVNSKEITDAIERNGLDYRIENREIAKRNAENFVNEVGSENALEAVRDNKIKGAEKAFVYSKIISILVDEIDANTNQEQRQELEAIHAKIIADITDEFGQETIEAGRFISALQDVYNSSSLKYNLTIQIDAHKASNNGVISDEVLAKLTEADSRIKELEKLITEAEINLKKAEEALLIKNIKDDIDKANKKDSKSKSVLTPKEQTRKTELRVKFFGTLNDITRMATLLADPEFREYLGLAFKQAKGDFNNFSKQILKEVGKGARKYLPQLFKEAGGKSDVSVTQLSTVKIGKKGNIVIPTQLFRDYVEQGETDIDVIAGLIKEDIADEFPDADIRDIRDAITGYGKRINPSRDEVEIEMSRLKIVGKLISAYEDALQGIRPLKSGLQRAKPTQQMREMRKEVNRLIKEIGLSEADLEKEWASALDRVKAQLNNQIEDLDKQIANGEKRKIERNPVKLDEEAKELRAIRDTKKKILDELVGKPELTEEELIARAEKSLELSIEKLQKEIASGEVEFKTRPDAKQSDKLTELRAQKKALTEIKNDMRAEAGLVEAQRMKTTKNRVKNQITELKRKIVAKEYAKKVVRPLREDAELLKLRAEKLLQQEIFDAQKYQDELKNRSLGRKFLDALLEVWNIERILRATGEASTVLIQGGILTTSRKFTNPKELAKIMGKLFTAIGSAKKSDKMAAMIKAHPDYPLAMKAKLALANPDYKSDVREENYTGDYANFAWDLPFMLAGNSKKGTRLSNIQKSVLGDVILNPFKRLTGLGKTGTDKISAKQQWKNINPFRALERGSTLYMNTLRMEEFARGVEMLRMEGKNEIDHLADYKLLANAINTMSGRANLPSALATNTKALSVIFFSAKNAISVINQVNPIYYGYLHFASTDGAQFKKTSVANKLAMYNMMRFVTITGATLLALKFAAGKDDDDEDVATIETDPRSSDFMKLKIGNIRWDLFHGQMGVLVLMARLATEQVKSTKDGKVEDLADKRFGQQNRLDLVSSFARNKLAPSASRLVNYFSTKEKLNPETGKMVRMTPFGKDYDDENSIANIKPMYWDAIKEIQAEDPSALVQFLTVVSAFGWNTGVYGGQTPMSKNELQILMSKRNPEYKVEKSKEDKAKTKTENAEKKKEDELFYRAEAARLGVEYIPLKVKIPANPNGQSRERRTQQKRGQ